MHWKVGPGRVTLLGCARSGDL
ncbi:hypothetical protein TIFTF001_036446, partial [Ficus carica]